jgi:hypothetical protein
MGSLSCSLPYRNLKCHRKFCLHNHHCKSLKSYRNWKLVFVTHIAAVHGIQHSLSSHNPPKQVCYCTNNSINKRRHLNFHTITTDIKRSSTFTLKAKGSTVLTYFHIPEAQCLYTGDDTSNIPQSTCIHLVSAICMPPFNNI